MALKFFQDIMQVDVLKSRGLPLCEKQNCELYVLLNQLRLRNFSVIAGVYERWCSEKKLSVQSAIRKHVRDR